MALNIVDASGSTVALASDQNGSLPHRPVHHSEVIRIQANKTRPADTTAYAAGDAIGASGSVVFTFDTGALGVPSGLIVGARLIRDATTNTTVRFRGIVYDGAPTVASDADNAQFPLTWANRTVRRGYIDFSNPLTGDAASGNDCTDYTGVLNNPQGILFNAADGVVRMVLTTRDAFTPEASKNYTIELDIVV